MEEKPWCGSHRNIVDLLGAIAAMVISMLLLGIDGVVKLSPPEGKFGGRT